MHTQSVCQACLCVCVFAGLTDGGMELTAASGLNFGATPMLPMCLQRWGADMAKAIYCKRLLALLVPWVLACFVDAVRACWLGSLWQATSTRTQLRADSVIFNPTRQCTAVITLARLKQVSAGLGCWDMRA